MTVKEFIEVLRAVDPEAQVFVSRDPEGNSYAPIDPELCDDCTIIDGESFLHELTPELEERGYSEEDVREGPKCIVVYPL